MPFSQFEAQVETVARHDARAMADLIVAVNQGTNGKPDEVKKLLRELRGT